MTREELVCVLKDYAKMTEEPPTGRAIEGQEEIMRRAANMIENSVETDRVLEIVDKWTDFALKGNGFMTALGALRNEIKALKGEAG